MSNLSNKLKKLSEQGFSHVETFLVMIVVVAIAGVGAYVIKHNESHAGSGCSTLVYANGSSGTCVKDIQTLVNFYNSNKLAKYTPLAIDGAYGPLTKAAVQQFQQTSNLATDGIVGQDTWKALCLPSSPPKNTTAAYKAALLDACAGTDKPSSTTTTTTTSSTKPASSSSTTSSTTSSTQSSTSTTTKKNVLTTQTESVPFKTLPPTATDTLGYDNTKITQYGKNGIDTILKTDGKYTGTIVTTKPINQEVVVGDSIILADGKAYPKGFTKVSLGSSTKEQQQSSTLFAGANAWFRGSIYPALTQVPGSGYGGDFIITACYNSKTTTVYFHALNTHGTNYDADGADVTLDGYYHTSGGGIAAADYSSSWSNNVTSDSMGVDVAASANPNTTTVWATVGIPTSAGTGSSGANVNTKSVHLDTLPTCLPTSFGTAKY